jgi:hypothetical protein
MDERNTRCWQICQNLWTRFGKHRDRQHIKWQNGVRSDTVTVRTDQGTVRTMVKESHEKVVGCVLQYNGNKKEERP